MYDALANACDAVDNDRSIRVFVVRAKGDSFAAGTDIRQFTAFTTANDGLAYERRLDAVLDRLEAVAVPTIAQVHGTAAGGGCAIALACDLRVCTPQAQFGMPMARTLGNCLSPANLARLVDALGAVRTKELLFTARFLGVDELSALGLVTRVADFAVIDEVVIDIANQIAEQAPLTLRATKDTLRRLAAKRRLESGAADDLIAQCYGSEDFREGVAAFLGKRKPHFTGR